MSLGQSQMPRERRGRGGCIAQTKVFAAPEISVFPVGLRPSLASPRFPPFLKTVDGEYPAHRFQSIEPIEGRSAEASRITAANSTALITHACIVLDRPIRWRGSATAGH